MSEVRTESLRIVDGYRLERPRRDALMPAGVLRDRDGRTRQLPRYFYEVESWDAAVDHDLHRLNQANRKFATLLHLLEVGD